MLSLEELFKGHWSFRLAYKASLWSEDNFPVGAVLFRKRSVLSAGCNKGWKTHPMVKLWLPRDKWHKGLHAEMDALLPLRPYDTENSTMTILRRRKDQDYGLAAPCGHCMSWLENFKIKKVYFTTNKGYDFIKIKRGN